MFGTNRLLSELIRELDTGSMLGAPGSKMHRYWTNRTLSYLDLETPAECYRNNEGWDNRNTERSNALRTT